MAIRRPSYYSPTWLNQDFLYLQDGAETLRFLVVKQDGSVYERESETFDYSNPPYTDDEQRGGEIVGRIDYSVLGQLITIDDWQVNWRDEWPLRIAVNHLTNCLYPIELGYTVRVAKETAAYAFWVSEFFAPLTNAADPETYLYFTPEVQKYPVVTPQI